jgi:hypothetical protein
MFDWDSEKGRQIGAIILEEELKKVRDNLDISMHERRAVKPSLSWICAILRGAGAKRPVLYWMDLS